MIRNDEEVQRTGQTDTLTRCRSNFFTAGEAVGILGSHPVAEAESVK
jgi:hypothetical protein